MTHSIRRKQNLSPVNNIRLRWDLLCWLLISYTQLANRTTGFICICSVGVMWLQVPIQRYCYVAFDAMKIYICIHSLLRRRERIQIWTSHPALFCETNFVFVLPNYVTIFSMTLDHYHIKEHWCVLLVMKGSLFTFHITTSTY